ncbi:MAG: hypothetical protein ACRCW1_10070 [Anaerotignaceae bacterium]
MKRFEKPLLSFGIRSVCELEQLLVVFEVDGFIVESGKVVGWYSEA